MGKKMNKFIQIFYGKIITVIKGTKKIIVSHLIEIYKLLYIIVSAVIVILPVLGSLGLTPFLRKAMKGIKKIRKIDNVVTINRKKIKAGYIEKGDVGFNELRSVIIHKKRLVSESKYIEQIGLAFGDLPLGSIARVGPNAMMYIKIVKFGEERYMPIIFSPFDPNSTIELN